MPAANIFFSTDTIASTGHGQRAHQDDIAKQRRRPVGIYARSKSVSVDARLSCERDRARGREKPYEQTRVGTCYLRLLPRRMAPVAQGVLPNFFFLRYDDTMGKRNG